MTPEETFRSSPAERVARLLLGVGYIGPGKSVEVVRQVIRPSGHGRRWRRSAETERVLRKAGWQPGRSVATETWEWILRERGAFVVHEAARQFLAEFGGVGVPFREPWDSMPWGEFRPEPLLALWDDEIFDDLSEQVGTVYVGMDSVALLAPTPDEAMQWPTRRAR
ncbi:SUKH-3 domain-containing protein [Streptomyces sp. NPDC087859]|uniref:SUKH-3 domain-containing protein n=1 Tax=Streptomyces sp. NPDC087859 TaxID=3365812 RepID=UPI00382BD209